MIFSNRVFRSGVFSNRVFRSGVVAGLLSIAALTVDALPGMARPASIDPAQTGGVNVRSGPSLQTMAIDSLPGGTPIEVLNIVGNENVGSPYWYYIRSTGRVTTEGWVASELIRFNSSRQTYGTLTGDPGDTINIRSAPNTDEAVLHTGIVGDLVTVGRSMRGDEGYIWRYVTYPNRSSGWVRADLIAVWPKGCIVTCPDN